MVSNISRSSATYNGRQSSVGITATFKAAESSRNSRVRFSCFRRFVSSYDCPQPTISSATTIPINNFFIIVCKGTTFFCKFQKKS